MTAYLLVHTSKTIHTVGIPIKDKNVKLEKILPEKVYKTYLPIFFYEDTKKYFYSLSIQSLLWYTSVTSIGKDENGEEQYLLNIATQDSLYKDIFDWIKQELNNGNTISILKMLEVYSKENKEREQEEHERFNSIYTKEYIKIQDVIDTPDKLDFAFHIEYEFIL